MSDPLQSIPLQSLPANDVSQSPEPAAAKASSPANSASDQPVRLVVEPVNGGQTYTYRLYDRATGALLIELPREEAVKLGQSPDYSAGQVLNTTA